MATVLGSPTGRNLDNAISKKLPIDYVVNNFPKNTSVYVEECNPVYRINGYWNLITFNNLSVYTDQLSKLNESITNLKENCEHIQQKEYCLQVANNFFDRLNEISSNQNAVSEIKLKQKRKRAAGAIVLSTLAGIAGSKIIDYIFNQGSTNNEEYTKELLKEQTSIIKLTEKQLNDTVNLLTSNVQATEISWMAKLIETELNEFEKQQNAIIQVILNRDDRLHTRFIDRKTLQKHIEMLQNKMPENVKIYGKTVEEKVEFIYALAKISAETITHNGLITKIKIPLITDYFNCKKLIPIPFEIHNVTYMLQLKHEFVLSNVNEFFLMNREKKEKCITLGSDSLCSFDEPVKRIKESNECEFEIIHSKNIRNCQLKRINLHEYFIKSKIHWLFFTKNSTNSINCNGRITSANLNGSGILKFISQCSLTTDNIKIKKEDAITTNTNSMQWSLLKIKKINKTMMTPELHEIEDALNAIELMQQNQQSHQNKNSFIIYILIAFCLFNILTIWHDRWIVDTIVHPKLTNNR